MRRSMTTSILCDECRAEIAIPWSDLGKGPTVEEFATSMGWQIDSLRCIDMCPKHTRWATRTHGLECPQCGAVVAPDRKGDHEKWHKS